MFEEHVLMYICCDATKTFNASDAFRAIGIVEVVVVSNIGMNYGSPAERV